MEYQMKTVILVIFTAVTSSGNTWSHGTLLSQDGISTRMDDLLIFPRPLIHTSSDEKLHHQLSSQVGSVPGSLKIPKIPYYEAVGNFPSSDLCSSSGYFSILGSCREFYHCEQLEDSGMFSIHQFSCPPDTIFDESRNKCDSAYHHIINKPECFTSKETDLITSRLQDESVSMPKKTHKTIRPTVKRLKRFSEESVLEGLKTPESLAKIASTFLGSVNHLNEDTYIFLDTKYYLQSVINKLIGMNGRIESAQLSSLESNAEWKTKAMIMQNIILQDTIHRQISVGTIRELMDQDISEKHINEAVDRGLIILRGENRPQFIQIRSTIGDVKKFIKREVMKAKHDIKMGFEHAANVDDESGIPQLVAKMLYLAVGIDEKLNNIENFAGDARKIKLVEPGGYIGFLKLYTLSDTLHDILSADLAIPKSASDVSAVLALDLFFLGLKMHASMLSSIASSYIFVARMDLKQRRLSEFNRNLAHAKLAIEMVQADLVSKDSTGFFEKAKLLLNRVQQLPFISIMNNLNSSVSENAATLVQLESVIKKFLEDNQVMRDPGKITDLNFETSSISPPMGPWRSGKQVSYAMQLISESGVSKLGEWSLPSTIYSKANPSIQLPAVNTGEIRIIYRRFNQDIPEIVAILYDHSLTEFRDTCRDILNSISSLNNDLAITELTTLLNDGADVNFTFENKMTPLHYAAKHGNVRAMKMLVNKGSDIHAKSSDNEEALHFAALYGTEEAVQYLISKRANVSAQTKSLGLSALHIAVANGYANTARVLLREGASVNIKDNQGRTPLHVSAIGNSNTMDILLQRQDLDVNAKDKDGLTPLHFAAWNKNTIFTEKLLDNENIDVRAIGHNSLLSPLHFAAMTGHACVIMWLIKKGAHISAVDNEGSTPLHYAAFYGNREAVLAILLQDSLLSFSNITNKEGKIPLDFASENEMNSCVEVLQMDINSLKISARELTPCVPNETPNNCSTEIVNNMTKEMENTCIHVGNVDSYVNLVMSMIPLHDYYTHFVSHSVGFRNFDNDLKVAQNHVKIWKCGDSIVKGIRETYKLAKNFEQVFNKIFEINVEPMKNITHNEMAKLRFDIANKNIKNLEIKRNHTQVLLKEAHGERLLQHFRNELGDIENDINKNRDILNNTGLPEILEELVVFLASVIQDTSYIEEVANKTKSKLEKFYEDLLADNSIFVYHAQRAENNFDVNLNEVKSNETEQIKRNISELQVNIEREHQLKVNISNKIRTAQLELAEARRDMEAQMHSNNILWWFGVFLTPLMIGIPMLVVADNRHTEYALELQQTLRRDEEERRLMTTVLENSQRELENLQNQLTKGVSDLEEAFGKHMGRLQTDLNQLKSGLQELMTAVSKLTHVEDYIKVFDGITIKLKELLVKAATAKSNLEREEIKTLIFNDLSVLKCNLNGAHYKIMDFEACIRTLEIE